MVKMAGRSLTGRSTFPDLPDLFGGSRGTRDCEFGSRRVLPISGSVFDPAGPPLARTGPIQIVSAGFALSPAAWTRLGEVGRVVGRRGKTPRSDMVFMDQGGPLQILFVA